MHRSAIQTLLLPLILNIFSIREAGCTTAAEYRRLADRCVQRGEYTKAADYYRSEAEVYRRIGDPNAAKVEEMKAERWSTDIRIYAEIPPDRKRLLALYTGAKHEPVYGCYLGAFLHQDEKANAGGFRGNQAYREDAFSQIIGKQLATTYMYRSYGVDFPIQWARALCAKGMAPHISWEPNRGLDYVRDDEYLRRFARAAASCGGPVFIRFAGEMNGDWTRYHGAPELYRRKFRLIHDVMERIAPNVAMIWCVNHIPEHNIDEYYPGDQYVDWVGVNFYSVIYHDNDTSRPGWFECPTSFLKGVYKKYAARKPIAICEYGASHVAALDGVDRADFACEKLGKLYAALPRLFPRVKLIDIFSCNNLKHAIPSRQLNDYCVTDNTRVLEAFKRAIEPDYYLTRAFPSSSAQADLPKHVKELASGAGLSGNVRLSAWVKTYDTSPRVVYTLDGGEIAKLGSPGDYSTDLDTSRFSKGKHTLCVTAVDSKGRLAGRKQVTVYF